MSRFFIDRPIFAWVVALFIIIAGLVSITKLPISQYPQVAPPTINVQATYAGADAQTIDDSVLSVIEREMNGIDGLDYMQSTSLSNGTGTLTLTFTPETNKDIAQVMVQNRLARVESRLPSAVRQVGVQVSQASSNFLMFVMLYSDDPNTDVADINDYVQA